MAGVPGRSERRARSAKSKRSARAAFAMEATALTGITPQRASALARAASKSSIACSTDASEKTSDSLSVAARLSTSRVNIPSILHVQEDRLAVALQTNIEAPGLGLGLLALRQ